MRKTGKLGYVEQATMQAFQWKYRYSGIFMVWCTGYLARPELVAFMRSAKANLMEGSGRFTRQSRPEAFMIVLDNVLEETEEMEMVKGQRIRTVTELEAIYSEAGLLVHKCSEREPMPGNKRDVMVWALY